MQVVLVGEKSLTGENNGRGREEEEEDDESRGEWVKVKTLALCPIYSARKTITAVHCVTQPLHKIWPSTWRTWRLTVAAHYTRKKRDMITSP